MENCIALIFPGEEDFGITVLEAHASGKPVIAYGAGGALETIKDGETGSFFNEQTPESLVAAIEKFQDLDYHPMKIRERAELFDRKLFKNAVNKFITEKIDEPDL